MADKEKDKKIIAEEFRKRFLGRTSVGNEHAGQGRHGDQEKILRQRSSSGRHKKHLLLSNSTRLQKDFVEDSELRLLKEKLLDVKHNTEYSVPDNPLIIDLNIFYGAFVNQDEDSKRVLQMVQDGLFSMVVSHATLSEIISVVDNQHLSSNILELKGWSTMPPPELKLMVEFVYNFAHNINYLVENEDFSDSDLQDPADARYLKLLKKILYHHGKLVTFDNHLLNLGQSYQNKIYHPGNL